MVSPGPFRKPTRPWPNRRRGAAAATAVSVDRDELGLAAEALRRDHAQVAARFAELRPFVERAWLRSWRHDIGLQRYVGMASPF